ncbi:MAG: PAS domain S-box protein [bacterium]
MALTKKEKQQLEHRFHLFYNAFQYSTDAIVITDLNGNIVEVNEAFTDLFGWSREEAIGKNTSIIRSDETTDKFIQDMWDSINNKGAWKGEIINRRKDGSKIPVLLSITPIYQKNKIIGYMGVEIDISQKKKIENQLLQEKEFTESLIETANSLIVGINLSGTIILFNRKCEEVTGYSKNEVIGKNWFELFLPERARPKVTEVFESILDGKLLSQHENPILTKNGQERLIAWSNTAIRNEKHDITGALSIGQDITAQKILEKQVLQAERLAIIGKMAAKVAHEIRSPLSSISLNAELLEDEIRGFASVNPEEAMALLKSIISEVERLTSLTEEYLQFSRLPESRPVKGQIESIIEEMMELLRQELNQKKIDVECNLNHRIKGVRFDRIQIRRALLNIIRNAIEAMPEGGKLRIWTDQRNHKGIINIEDTGAGIPNEEIEKIFEPFFTTKDFGTGLGLAISQQIIHEHGGQIYCNSEVGRGTSFTLVLPLDEKERGS